MEKESRWNWPLRILFILLGLLFVALLWEIIAFSTGGVFLPELTKTFLTLFTLFQQASTWQSLGLTMGRILLTFVVSGIFGIALGQLAGYFPKLSYFLSPLITILRAMPTIALVLLLVVYVPAFSYYVVFLVLFPVFYLASLEGASSFQREYGMVLRQEGKRRWFHNIWKLSLPLSHHHLFLGAIQAAGMAFKIEILAETFARTTSFHGIGYEIYFSYTQVDYERMMAFVLLILFLSLIIDGILYLLKYLISKRLLNK